MVTSIYTASMTSLIKFDIQFEMTNLNFAGIYVYDGSNGHYDGLWGHGDLQMTLEVTAELKFEFIGLNNLCHQLLWPLNADISRLLSYHLSSIDLRARASPQVKRGHVVVRNLFTLLLNSQQQS